MDMTLVDEHEAPPHYQSTNLGIQCVSEHLSSLVSYIILVLRFTGWIGSREAAYLYAVWSAGLTYAIAQACSQGSISSCGCDMAKSGGASKNILVKSLRQRPRSPPNAANGGSYTATATPNPSGVVQPAGTSSGWKWGGCSADIRTGSSLAKRFADSREMEGDGRSLMNLHNNKAGRKVSGIDSLSIHYMSN